jgi:hypothetical protein
MKLVLIATCFFVWNHGCLFGREVTGVVYSDHSGPSGHGTGKVQLSTKAGLVSFHYQKPVKQRFSNPNCGDVGAIWTVRAEDNELISVRCDGLLDERVHSAWMAVRNYIRSIAETAGHTLGYKPNRPRPLRVRMSGIDVDISGYLDFGESGMCLDMYKRVDSKSIIIRSSADCYFYPNLDFRVEEASPNTWRVVEVNTVDSTAR